MAHKYSEYVIIIQLNIVQLKLYTIIAQCLTIFPHPVLLSVYNHMKLMKHEYHRAIERGAFISYHLNCYCLEISRNYLQGLSIRQMKLSISYSEKDAYHLLFFSFGARGRGGRGIFVVRA